MERGMEMDTILKVNMQRGQKLGEKVERRDW